MSPVIPKCAPLIINVSNHELGLKVISFLLIPGLPSVLYYHGATSLLAGGLPAAISALVAAVLLFLPVLAAADSPCADWLDYLRLRFQSTFLVVLVRGLACLPGLILAVGLLLAHIAIIGVNLNVSNLSCRP